MVTEFEPKTTGATGTEFSGLPTSDKERVLLCLSNHLVLQSLSIHRHLSPSLHHVLVIEPTLASPNQLTNIQLLLTAIKNGTQEVTSLTDIATAPNVGVVVVADRENNCVWLGETTDLPSWLSSDGHSVAVGYRAYLVA